MIAQLPPRNIPQASNDLYSTFDDYRIIEGQGTVGIEILMNWPMLTIYLFQLAGAV